MPRPTVIAMRAAKKDISSLSTQGLAANSLVLFCHYCTKRLDSETARNHHVSATPYCREAERNEFNRDRKKRRFNSQSESNTLPDPKCQNNSGILCESPVSNNVQSQSAAPLPQPSRDNTKSLNNHQAARNLGSKSPPGNAGIVVEEFPNCLAGMPISDEVRPKPDLAAYIKARGVMGVPEHFEVAKLLMTTGLTDGDKDRHLKSSKYRGSTPWINCGKMLEDVDKYLPHGPGWEVVQVKIKTKTGIRVQYLYWRNIIELIKEILGNPELNGDVAFAPVRKWTTEEKKTRVIDEMWTANWWWRMQERLGDKGAATIAALILASDQTNLSIICGGQKAYPVYATLGNVSKSIRRKQSKRATILLGYLPVEDFSDIKDNAERQRLQDELVHRSMEVLLEPLKRASIDGVDIWCADGQLRRVFPIVAAYMADWPEQNLMACTSEGSCPICVTQHRNQGQLTGAPLRQRGQTMEALMAYFDNNDPGELKQLNLKPVWPWWATIPYVDFATCIAPDLLHQLYQGVFKTHLMGWLNFTLGSNTVDECLMAMPKAEGLRHFSKGVSGIGPRQWTGRESKDLIKQVLPIAVGKCSPEFTALVRSVIDFIHRAHSASMTDKDIDALQHSLDTLHKLKEIMVNPIDGYYQNNKRWDKIAKLHMMEHYAHSIRELGTPDGYNTEGPENLHIIYAKEPWRASNKREPLPQMTKYLQRLDAIRIQRHYMDAYYEVEPDPESDDQGEEDFAGYEESPGEGEMDVDCQQADEEQVYSEADPSSVAYPNPRVNLAKTPTRRNVAGDELMEVYGARDLLTNTARYLARTSQVEPNSLGLESHDKFDVWHRIYLYHQPLPFSPLERPRRDVIRTTPPTSNATYGFEIKGGVFDTALVLDAAVVERVGEGRLEHFGLRRYRAARVRAIFSLPARLKHLYKGHLAYIELFTPFAHSVSPFHGMHVTGPDRRTNGNRRTAVIPVSSIAFAAHLAPQFHKLDSDLMLSASIDILGVAQHFFLNHYYSHHIYLFMMHWRRKLQEQRDRLAEYMNQSP